MVAFFAEATGLSLPRWGAPLSFRPRLADESRDNVTAMARHKAGHCRGIASTLVGEGADETVVAFLLDNVAKSGMAASDFH